MYSWYIKSVSTDIFDRIEATQNYVFWKYVHIYLSTSLMNLKAYIGGVDWPFKAEPYHFLWARYYVYLNTET